MEQKYRWHQIDVLYTIGIVLVIFGHSHSSNWSSFDGTVLQKAIAFVYTFHMPLFFFIAGFLFQNSATFEQQGYGKWIGEKALRLLVPYLFWTGLALVPKYYLEHHGLDGLTPLFVLRSILIPRESVWGHFWFIPVMFLIYMVFGAYRKIFKRWDGTWVAFIGTVITFALSFIPIKTNLLGLADLKNVALFFSLGMLFRMIYRERIFKPKRIILSLIMGVMIVALTLAAVWLWCLNSTSQIVPIATAVVMLIVCWIVSELFWGNRVTKWISKHNFTIYIFSWFFQATVMLLCEKLRLSWLITFVLMFIAGITGSLLLSAIVDVGPWRRNRAFCYIFGVRWQHWQETSKKECTST